MKSVASMLPLATDEIRKLNAFKFFLNLNAMNAFWFIPLDEESEKPIAFQTNEGLIDSLWAVAQPVRCNRLHSIQLWTSIYR